MSTRAKAVLAASIVVAGVCTAAVALSRHHLHDRENLHRALSAVGQVRGLSDEQREAFLETLTNDIDATRRRQKRLRLLIAAGLVLVLAGAGVAGTLARRAPPAPADLAETNTGNRRGLEELLKRRLEELYSTRFRAWESERFAAYGELAAGLSHGLKTPLASVRAAAQVAQQKVGPDHPASETLDEIIEEVDLLVDQIQRFLHAAGDGAPVPARISPEALLETLETDYSGAADDRGLILEVSTSDAPEIHVDPALLEMTLRNIVENALAAATSRVEVHTGPTSPPERAGLDNAPPPPGNWVEICIADDGPGIPREVLNARKVESRKATGSGLGLAIARRVVARHGGAVMFDTREQGGTRVRIVLPAAKPSEELA